MRNFQDTFETCKQSFISALDTEPTFKSKFLHSWQKNQFSWKNFAQSMKEIWKTWREYIAQSTEETTRNVPEMFPKYLKNNREFVF